MKLESERLIIRDFEIKDAAFYFDLFNDPDWKRFINDKKLKSVAETAEFLKKMRESKLEGLGYFTVILKETNEAIGVSTALKRDKLQFVDIGYGFLPKGRGKGYAQEATKLIIEFVHDTFKQEKVLAFTMPENKNSQKLLQKLGFKFIGNKVIIENKEDAVFEYLF
ncbi:GNAT family N-acetyltransferase [Polaribacter sargassicola]|uniref:GNAT family N-acetyltransferase n=1 Tax=Polaribacter sargassicola TaxID=2836891 RepID=UPI001F23F836|nr:GNAT family N-acetyltransferase [Polaribacter sp. DS7-9]